MKIKKNQLYFIYIIAVVLVYFIQSYNWSQSIPITKDTLEYQYNFNDIFNKPFPYGIEFIQPLFMYIIKALGGGFRDFIYASYLLWLPVIIHLAKSIKKPYNFIVLMFFFSDYFGLNAAFLIRQYYSAVFFLCYLYLYSKGNKLYYFFILLSLFSHLSSLTWFIVSSNCFVNSIKSKCKFFIFFIMVMIFSYINIFEITIAFFEKLTQYIDFDVINRKLFYYTLNENKHDVNVPLKYFLFAFFSFFISYYALIKLDYCNKIYLKILSIIMMQSFFIIIFHENLILANRLGFFVFFFYVPSILYSLILLTKNDIR